MKLIARYKFSEKTLFIFIGIVLILCLLSTPSYGSVNRDHTAAAKAEHPNLVGYWSFDDHTADDSSGVGNNGEIKGTVEFGSSPNGTDALIFNGTDTKMEVPSDPSLNIIDEITIEAWIKPGINLPNGKTYVLVSKFFDKSGYKLVWDGVGYFYLYVTRGRATISKKVRLNAGQWYYLTISYKSNTRVGKIYLNQWDITSEVKPRIMTTNSTSFFFGAASNDESPYFKGSMDELRIYDVIRSPDNPLPISSLIFSRDPGLVIGLLLLLLAIGAMAVSNFVPSLSKKGLAILIFSWATIIPLFFNINGITLLSLGKSLSTRHSPGQTLPASIFLLGLIVLLWTIGFLRRRSHFKRTSFNVPIILFFSMNCIALVVGLIHSFSMTNLLFFFQAMAPLLSYYVAVNLFDEVKQVKRAIYGMIIVATAVALPLLIQILFAIRIGYPRSDVGIMVDHLWRFNIYQMYGHFPLALVNIVAIALALFLKVRHSMRTNLYLLFSAAVLIVLVPLLTSKAAVLMLIGIIGIEVFLLKFPRKARILLLLAAVAALVIFLVLPKTIIWPQWANLLKFQEPRGLSHRVDHLSEALRIISANPLWGKGYVASLMTKAGPRVIRSHNQYLELAVKSGLISLSLFLLLIGMALRRSYLLFKNAPDDFSKAIGLGVFSWLITVGLIGNMLQGPFIQTFTAILSWFLIGTGEILHRLGRKQVEIPKASF